MGAPMALRVEYWEYYDNGRIYFDNNGRVTRWDNTFKFTPNENVTFPAYFNEPKK